MELTETPSPVLESGCGSLDDPINRHPLAEPLVDGLRLRQTQYSLRSQQGLLLSPSLWGRGMLDLGFPMSSTADLVGPLASLCFLLKEVGFSLSCGR